jgi:hypothetical protein
MPCGGLQLFSWNKRRQDLLCRVPDDAAFTRVAFVRRVRKVLCLFE